MLRNLHLWHGHAAGAVVGISPDGDGALVMVCGPKANLGEEFVAVVTRVCTGENKWRTDEMAEAVDLARAESARIEPCQRSIAARRARGWDIKVIRQVSWSCARRDGADDCLATTLEMVDERRASAGPSSEGAAS